MSRPELLAAMIAGLCALLAAAIGAQGALSRTGRAAKVSGRLRLACPHGEINLTPDGDLAARPLPNSPIGPMLYISGLCGGVIHELDAARTQDDWPAAFMAGPQKASDAYWKARNAAGGAPKEYEPLRGE